MPYCPKCGKEVDEKIDFCPNCGAGLGRERPATRPVRVEKREKTEKAEKFEKKEKAEKEEVSPAVPLVGGIVLIFFGITFFLTTSGLVSLGDLWPYVLLLLGIVIVIAAVYAGVTASKKSPRP